MSNKPNRNIAAKRQAKTQKRKGKTHTVKPNLSEFGIMLKRAQFAARQGLVSNVPSIDNIDFGNKKLIDDAKKHLGMIYRYFGYLVFTAGLITEKVITDHRIGIDLSDMGKRIVSINNRIRNLPLLDEETVYATEIFEVAETLQSMAMDVNSEIIKLEGLGKIIDGVIVKCGESLPPKADGSVRSSDEVFNEVLTLVTDDFMHRNILP